MVCTQGIICTFDKNLILDKAHIFQVTTVEQSILNLLFPLLHLRHGFTLDYQCIQAKTIAFIRSLENSIVNIFDPEGLKSFTSLRLGLVT